jgi:hypothetical protein
VSALDCGINDCAVVALDARTGEERHTAIVPHGTRFPAPPDVWRRQHEEPGVRLF